MNKEHDNNNTGHIGQRADNLYEMVKGIHLPDIAVKLGLQKNSYNWHCFNVASHNNDDANASLKIYDNGFHCFGCGLKGNRIELIKQVLKCDYQAAIEWVAREFHISNSQQPSYSQELRIGQWSLRFREGFSNSDLQYWLQYNINEHLLKSYKVRSIIEISGINRFDKAFKINSSSKSPIFCFEIIKDLCYKIYQPFSDKKFKFLWIGAKPKEYIFGLEEIPEYSDEVIITSGEKDTIAFASLGLHAVSFNSETETEIGRRISLLKSRFKNLFICYDIDKTGIIRSTELSEKYRLKMLALPVEMLERGLGKDISYFLKAIIHHETKKIHNDILNIDIITQQMQSGIANIATQQPTQSNDIVNEEKTSFIPDDLYINLPKFLSDCTTIFQGRERDVFLLSALSVISSCIPNIYGLYDNSRVGPNIYLIIVAPASAGKGVTKWAYYLGHPIHRKLIENSKREYEIYEMKLKDKDNREVLNKPKYKILFIPANSSATAMLQVLDENDGNGIIFESEADSLNNTLAQDWGNYSDFLRKAFHHEPVSYMRRANKEHIEICNPQLSVVLTCTLNQMLKLFPTAENGLFSRFIIYKFDIEPFWKDVFERNPYAEDYDSFFREKGETLKSLYFSIKDKEIHFELTKLQQEHFNNYFSIMHEETYQFFGNDIVGSIRRIGLICFRIAMILSIIRYIDALPPENIICEDVDFNTAIALVAILKEHTVKTFNQLPSDNQHSDLSEKVYELYTKLPNCFKRIQGLEIAKNYVSDTTFDRMLKNRKYFLKEGYGKYHRLL
jgi:hypothetical protein